jgi:hypothetical protein
MKINFSPQPEMERERERDLRSIEILQIAKRRRARERERVICNVINKSMRIKFSNRERDQRDA